MSYWHDITRDVRTNLAFGYIGRQFATKDVARKRSFANLPVTHKRGGCLVEETYLPGMSVSLVARRHGIGGNQIFTWRRLEAQGALTTATAGEEVVPASEYRALEAQVRELHRLLDKHRIRSIMATSSFTVSWVNIFSRREKPVILPGKLRS